MNKTIIKIGYGRVSTGIENSKYNTQDASLENQKELLKKYGCEYIFLEHGSGKKDNRPKFIKALKLSKKLAKKYPQAEVSFVVIKNDRFSRKFKTLIFEVEELEFNNVNYVSLLENIDTSQKGGKLLFQIMGSFSEYFIVNNSENIKMGLEKARKDGKILGRPRNIDLEKEVIEMYKNPSNTIKFIATSKNVSEKTIYNIAKRNNLSRKLL